MLNRLLIIVVLCFIGLKAGAQFLDKKIYLVDSLDAKTISESDQSFLDEQIKDYRTVASDTARIQILANLVENLQDEKIWMKYNHLLNTISKEKLKKLPDPNNRIYFIFKAAEAQALNNFGYYYFNFTNRFDLALSYYNEGLKINEDLNNYRDLITSYSNVGNTYQNQGDLNKALIYFQKALELDNKVPDKLLFLAPLNNIAQVYFYLNDTVKALETLKKAFKISAKSDNDFLKGSLLHNIGSLTYYKGDRTGIQTLEKALAFRRQIGDKKGTLQTTLSLAGIENNNKNFGLCEKYLKDAAQLVVLFPNSNIEALYYTQLGNYYEAIGKTNLAISNLEKSVSIYKDNLENADMYKALSNLLNLYSTNNQKYALKKLEAYELQQRVAKNIDKTNAQKLLLKQKYDEDLKVNEAKFKFEQQLKDEKNKAEKKRQQLILLIVCLILVVVLVFSFFIFRALKVNKQKNKIISEQKIKVEKQKHLIEEKHKDITDSITYAHRIQSSLIPTQEALHKSYSNISILFQPRDIVSGDFYWYSKLKDKHMFALADCTGHGVPGAFMSFIGINHLNTLINEKGLTQPSLILNELKKGVVASLNSGETGEAGKKDGMDVALISFNDRELVFSGANQSVYILRNSELIELKGNKQPIGLSDKNESFSDFHFQLLPTDRIILYSDGLVDQFGGAEGKKLKSKILKSWLTETAHLPLQEQRKTIETRLSNYKEHYEQTDDITLAIIQV